MTDFNRVLGLPLEKALSVLKAEGISPIIETTAPPHRPDKTGTLRVVGVQEQGNKLIVAAFNDASPARV